jgi:hypothetical protein
MKRIFFIAAAVSLILFSTSCQKEVSVDSGSGNSGGNGNGNGNGSSTLKGDWKFISQEADLKSTVQYTLPVLGTALKSITITKYTTLDNKGDIIIDDKKMTLTGISYRVATTSHVELYEDNNLTDTLSMPFAYTMPEYVSDADYQLVDSDSIRFTNTSFSFVQGSSMPSGPSQMKYVIEGNKLKLIADYKESKTETQQGITAQVLHEVKMIINCEKK